MVSQLTRMMKNRCPQPFGPLGLIVLLTMVTGSGAADAADEFSKVQCGTDIAKELIGSRVTTDPVVRIEARHKDLQLKDRGGYEASSTLFLSSWQICGQEYMEMVDRNSRITDVIAVPRHSANAPESIGACSNPTATARVVVAILGNDGGDSDFPATVAWQVDEVKKVFRKLPVEALRCPRNEIVTGD
jgi:hypothetical protein